MSRFRSKLVKMIKDAGSKFDDYWLDELMCKNDLILVQQARNLAKRKRKIF